MPRVQDVQGWMRFFGWTNSGGPGSKKVDADNTIIGVHCDQVWHRDVDEACLRIAKQRAVQDLKHGSPSDAPQQDGDREAGR